MSKMKSCAFAIATLCAPSGSAFAENQDLSGFSGLIDGDFDYSRTCRSCDLFKRGMAIDTDQYLVHGALLYTFDNPGFGFQIDGQDNFYFGVKHNEADLWSTGGTAFFRDDKGTIGLSGSYFAADAPAAPFFSGKKSIESYGFFGEYYPFRSLTLMAKGGGTSGPVGLTSYFGGGGLTWYEYPDLAFHTEINFTSFSGGDDWTDYNASIDYLPFHSLPVSIAMGYDHSIVARVGYTSTFFASLKFHFGQGRTLVDFDRTGPVQYTGNATPGSNLKF